MALDTPLQALLFDLDGTLTETNPLHYRAWELVLADLGLALTPALYDRMISGRTNAQIVADLLPDRSVAEGAAVSDRKEALFRELAPTIEPVVGLMPLLGAIERWGLHTAVVTNAPGANAAHMLAGLGLADRFETVVLAEDAPPGKPDPAPYQMALDRLGVTAAAAIAFEDSPAGVRSAVAAGILTIGVGTTHPPEELRSAGATVVVANFADLNLQALLRSRLGDRAAPHDWPLDATDSAATRSMELSA